VTSPLVTTRTHSVAVVRGLRAACGAPEGCSARVGRRGSRNGQTSARARPCVKTLDAVEWSCRGGGGDQGGRPSASPAQRRCANRSTSRFFFVFEGNSADQASAISRSGQVFATRRVRASREAPYRPLCSAEVRFQREEVQEVSSREAGRQFPRGSCAHGLSSWCKACQRPA